MTLKELLDYGKETLVKEQISEGELDAWYLLEFVCQIDRSYYFLHLADKVEEEKVRTYKVCIEKRSQRLPLQQIMEKAYFYGLEFYVNSHVLIPRFDTEVLVEHVLKLIEPGMNLLDLCCGSGCILLSLLQNTSNVRGLGVDISKEALKVAQYNASKLCLEATFLESDLFAKVKEEFDVIVSNPPYIKTRVIEILEKEVKDHEPMLALDGKEDGLFFYRKIVDHAPSYLKEGGYLCFEIGHDQGLEVGKLLEKNFYQIQVQKDLAGLDRVVIARKKKTV